MSWRRKGYAALAVVVVTVACQVNAQSAEAGSKVPSFMSLAQECAPWVAPQTLAAIVKTESQFRPLTIGVNGGARLVRQPANKQEAIVTAKWLIGNGYNVDLGLGQINSSNLAKVGLSVEDTFDPCKNLAASATIFHGGYKVARAQLPTEQGAIHAAYSIYNTGSMKKGFSNGYVQKVVANSNALQGTAEPAVQPIRIEGGKAASMPARPAGGKQSQQIESAPDGAANPAQPTASETTYESWDIFKNFGKKEPK